jgi:hypothetical protein
MTLEPPLRAATGTIFLLLFFSGAKTLIPGIGFVLTMPFQVVLFFIQGVFVTKFARESGITDRTRYVGMAFKSASWTMLFNFALFVIAMFFASAISVGAWLLMLPLILLGEAGTMVVMMVSAMLGAWASGYNNGKNLIGISIVLILGLVLVLGLLIVTIGVFLYARFK